MALKIKPDDYETLKNAISQLILVCTREGIAAYKERVNMHQVPGVVRDPAMRFRWDLLHATKLRIGDGVGMKGDIDLYAYLDDDHIDSALKRIVTELEI